MSPQRKWKILKGLGLAGLLLAGPARAEICSTEPVPAATLLLPYFEVDLTRSDGITTLIGIHNASAAATLAHVTLWTDEAVPTLNFDIYLTGYDVQTMNLRDLFTGALPRTAPLGRDPGDVLSHKGPLSEDSAFPGCEGLPYGMPALDAGRSNALRLAHTGQFSPPYGGCLGADYGDHLARGYLTVDVVTRCSTLDPTRPGYFTGVAGDRNVLWGNYTYVDPGRASATGEDLVHIESCPHPSSGNGAGRCPFAAGAATFYGRYAAVAGKDQREPLSTTFGAEFLDGGAFSGGTDLIVWRDTRVLPTGADGPHPCTTHPHWFPLNTLDVVAFDEQENVSDLCHPSDNFDPPLGGPVACFPLATQRVHVQGGNVIGDDPVPPYSFGWMFLNLGVDPGSPPFTPAGLLPQAWVSIVASADGRFAASSDAVQLDRGCDATFPGKVLIR